MTLNAHGAPRHNVRTVEGWGCRDVGKEGFASKAAVPEAARTSRQTVLLIT